MKPEDLLLLGIDPAINLLHELANIKSPDESVILLLAIAGQESGWKSRKQYGGGTAHGFWECERYGGVAEVMQKTPQPLQALCKTLSIDYDGDTIYQAIVYNDILAAGVARLLVWQDPAALPSRNQEAEGWNYYQRNWRPGIPRPKDWAANWETACKIV